MGRKRMYNKRLIIAFDKEMFEWLKSTSVNSKLTYSQIIERALTRVRFGI